MAIPSTVACRICGTSGATERSIFRSKHEIACRRCGDFSVTFEAAQRLTSPYEPTVLERLAVSSWLRENPGTQLDWGQLESLLSRKYPSVGERAEKLLLAIERQCASIDDQIQVPLQSDGNWDLQAYSWSADRDEVLYLLNEYLVGEKKWLVLISQIPNTYVISPRGHDHLDELRRIDIDSVQGFCAMWFDSSMNVVWKDAIAPAIIAAGYEPVRVDKIEHSNRIDDEILAQLRRSRFVVADFTDHRHGVYFEAGFALGLGRTVIWTVREDELAKTHFDNRQYNFILWRESNLPKLRDSLANRIVALLGQGPRRT